MKRKYVYTIVSLIAIVFAILSSSNTTINTSYSLSNSEVCQTHGYEYRPYNIVRLNAPGSSYDGMELVFSSYVVDPSDLPTPKKSGYTFNGWKDSSGGTFHIHTTETIVPDPEDSTHRVSCYKRRTYVAYASWTRTCPEPYPFPVKLFLEGSLFLDETSDRITSFYASHSSIIYPTRSGYSFSGWYVDPQESVPFTGNNYRITENYLGEGCYQRTSKLYAHWVKNNTCPTATVYNLYYNSNGGTSIPMEYKTGSNVSFSFPTPTKSGYTFDGWYKTSSFSAVANPSPSGINFSTQTLNGCPVRVGTVYAKWKEIVPVNPNSDPPDNPTPTPTPDPRVIENDDEDEDDDNEPSIPSSSDGSGKSGKGKKDSSKDKDNTKKTCPNVINTLVISFNTDEGTELEDYRICLTCDEEKIEVPKPEKDGKNFVGWYTDESLEHEVILNGLNTDIEISQFNVSIDKNEDGCDSDVAKTILYARYEDATCKTPDVGFIDMNFVPGDEFGEIEDVKKCLECDEDYYDLPILKKKGYIFAGWYIDADYSRLVSRKINVNNAVKYMNVTRDFVDGCSTDTVSTILYARWIPEKDVKNVRVLFVSQGKVVAEKLYDLNKDEMELPDFNVKGVKLLGWYMDNEYLKPLNGMKEFIANSYGVELRSGQLFLYAYAKTEDVKGVDKKIIFIGIGVVAVLGLLFFISKRKGKETNKKQNNNNQNQNYNRVVSARPTNNDVSRTLAPRVQSPIMPEQSIPIPKSIASDMPALANRNPEPSVKEVPKEPLEEKVDSNKNVQKEENVDKSVSKGKASKEIPEKTDIKENSSKEQSSPKEVEKETEPVEEQEYEVLDLDFDEDK